MIFIYRTLDFILGLFTVLLIGLSVFFAMLSTGLGPYGVFAVVGSLIVSISLGYASFVLIAKVSLQFSVWIDKKEQDESDE